MTELSFRTLQDAVAGRGAAIRAVTRLQPAGGPGDKVFPPTYQGGVYVDEDRWLDGEQVRCVLLDSVQSQANRMEEALLEAQRLGRMTLPSLEVDFGAVGLPQYGRLSVLQAPHRIADAILRDSWCDGEPFRKSPIGQRFVSARPLNATGLLETCPTALVFGVWDSTGFGTGGLGAKFARVVASEIVGVGVVEGRRAAVRVDPLGIQKQAATIYESDGPFGWTPDEKKARHDDKQQPIRLKRGGTAADAGRPSVINHGNIITDIGRGGVTFRYALQTTVLSLAGLRKLRFPDEQGRDTPGRDLAARTYLAALGLCAIALQYEAGYDLRSRCVLVPEARRTELVPNHVAPAEEIALSADGAIKIYEEARGAAEKEGFQLSQSVTLRPSAELEQLIKRNELLIEAGPIEEPGG